MIKFKVIKFVNLKDIDPLDTRTFPLNDSDRDANGYYVTDNIGHGFIVHGPDVTYTLNYDGFRTKHFNQFDNNKDTILFAGCSWTFGEGLPEEYTWPSLVAKNFTSPDFYNIGYMGMSISHIIKSVYSFIRKYGKPNYLFICFPDIQRNLMYSEKIESYIKAYANTTFIGSQDKDREKYTINYQDEDNLLIATSQISALEDYCQEAGIKLVWTTWVYRDYDVFKMLGFKFLMDPDIGFVQCNPSYNKSNSPYYENPDDFPYWEEARDGAHPGTAWTHFISNRFISTVRDLYEEKA